MTGCWNEGALQTYLDGELAEAQMYVAVQHLQSCAACRTRLERLAATAARVNALLDALVLDVPVAVSYPAAPLRAGSSAWWVRGAVAAVGLLAISAAIGVLTLARRPQVDSPVRTATKEAAVQPSRAILSPTPAPPLKVRPKRIPKPKRLPGLDDFLPLDGVDPIQVGVVVRVTLPVTGDAQAILADLVIGEDGRARAIRFVQ